MFKISSQLNLNLGLQSVAVLLISFYGLRAQTRQDSIQVFNEMKDEAALRLFIAYVEDFRLDDWEKGTINSPEEKATYQKLLDLIKQESSIDSATVTQILDNGDWKEKRRTIYDEYRHSLNHNNDHKFQNIEFTPSGVSNSKREEIISQLNKKYRVNIEQYSPPAKMPTNAQEINNDRHHDASKLYNLPVVIPLSVLVVILFVLFVLEKKKNVSLERTKIKKTPSSTTKEEKSNSNLINENNRLKDENKKLKNDIQELRNNSAKKESIIGEVIQTNTRATEVEPLEIQQDVLREQTIQIEVGYFSSPFEKNKFSHEDFKIEVDSKSLYKVESVGIDEWTLTLYDDANYKRALRSPNVFLDPVCDNTNLYTPEVTAVVVVENGLIVRSGNDWNVIKRPKIRFI